MSATLLRPLRLCPAAQALPDGIYLLIDNELVEMNVIDVNLRRPTALRAHVRPILRGRVVVAERVVRFDGLKLSGIRWNGLTPSLPMLSLQQARDVVNLLPPVMGIEWAGVRVYPEEALAAIDVASAEAETPEDDAFKLRLLIGTIPLTGA